MPRTATVEYEPQVMLAAKIPETLHLEVKKAVLEERTTVRTFVTRAIRRELKRTARRRREG